MVRRRNWLIHAKVRSTAPSMLSQVLAAVEAAPCYARRDASGAQVVSATVEVVALVGMEFVRSCSRTAAPLTHRSDGVDHRGERCAVVNVRAGQNDGERDAGPVDQNMAFRPGLPRSVGFGPIVSPPFLAAMDEESTEALNQSISPARLSRSSMWRWDQIPRPSILPDRSTAPACHARAAADLARRSGWRVRPDWR